MNQKKLENSELSKLKSLNSAHSTDVSMLAHNEIDISRLSKKKENLIVRFESSESNLLHFESDLIEKYGKGIRIDLPTGNIISLTIDD